MEGVEKSVSVEWAQVRTGKDKVETVWIPLGEFSSLKDRN